MYRLRARRRVDNRIVRTSACVSAPALLSSAVEIYPHQIQAAVAVLSDPVQRYMLVDGVGLGKTIEAGLIIRQTLLDQAHGRVVVIAPDVLRRQRQAKLRKKFFIDDYTRAIIKRSAGTRRAGRVNWRRGEFAGCWWMRRVRVGMLRRRRRGCCCNTRRPARSGAGGGTAGWTTSWWSGCRPGRC
jgi:hypothetical protein